MSARGSRDRLFEDLKTQAAEWIEEQFTFRMQEVGVDKEEVRRQLETEAEHWVQYNVDQRNQGKKGTPSPDFYLSEEKPYQNPISR